MTRTSLTDPIEVRFLPADLLGLPGRVGLTFAPGKQDGVKWGRDLDLDLDRLRDTYRIDFLVPLLEDHEMRFLQIPNLVEGAESRGMRVRRFPIVDVTAPPLSRMGEFIDLVEAIIAAAERGETVAVHCRGGVGRAGMVGASVLAWRGMPAEEAVRTVRAVRQFAVEVHEQEQWVAALARERARRFDRTAYDKIT